MKKKVLSLVLGTTMLASVFAGCGSSASSDGAASAGSDAAVEEGAAESTASAGSDAAVEEGAAESTASAEGGKVYYLNFKPEADEAWQNLAAAYTEETGVPVTVVTAASGQYETTLQSEIAKTDAPTLFQVNGPVGLASWKDYCYDLTGSDIANNITSDSYLLKNGEEVAGIAYVIESYGIIVNKTLLEQTGHSLDEITSFDTLKAVADDIQANKDAYGVEGAFTSAGMDSSSDWRFKTHLANLPIYYEYQNDGIADTEAIKGDFLDGYKNVFDLYITDSTTDPTQLATKTSDDSQNEFIEGKAVFYQNGSWEYSKLSETFEDDELAMIPIYFGQDDAAQGLCTGTENYWCVNKEASAEDIQATLDFINWCTSSETGTKAMADDMGFTIPFKTAQTSSNVFVKQDAEYTAAGKTPVSWNFTTMPSEEWKNVLGEALTAYAAGAGDWDAVKAAFVDNWATEKALNAQ